jgi:murein DD-endopeptidase MepM/ murein hydrolase activator NlpD
LTSPLLLGLLLTAPTAEVVPAQVRAGDAVLVQVREAATMPSGALAGRPLRFWPAGDQRWLAVAPLPMETATGPAAAEIMADGLPLGATFELTPPGWAAKALRLPPRFVEPPAAARRQMALDQKAITRAYAQPFGPPRLDGPLAVPLDAEPTGGFGDQRVYNGTVDGVHYGLDLGAAAGDRVGASGDGEVVLARDCYMSGQTVLIWHGAGVFTAYFHLSRMEVKVGQLVTRGQAIGRVGSTGRSTGPHLHWGVKVDGLWVDPRSALRLDLAAGDLSAPPARPAPPPPSADGAAALPR